MTLRCPTCKHDVLMPPQNKAFPFCSARCREVDLGKWLMEEYRVAGEPADTEEDEKPAVPGQDENE